MERAFTWIASVLIGAALSSPAATARDLGPEMRVLLGHFQEQRRIAMAYLRTDNVDLGAIEIETLRDRWLADRRAIEAAVAADRELAGALAATEKAVLASLQAVEAADSPRALVLLDEAAIPLGAWRKSNGIRLFSDCIAEVSVAFEPLHRYRSSPPDLAAAGGALIIAPTARVEQALAQCDREAPADVAASPEFRRLVDGMTASLRQMPQALASRDGAYLHRLLIEQRSFERLLVFRYG
jgi:hypothetical protein